MLLASSISNGGAAGYCPQEPATRTAAYEVHGEAWDGPPWWLCGPAAERLFVTIRDPDLTDPLPRARRHRSSGTVISRGEHVSSFTAERMGAPGLRIVVIGAPSYRRWARWVRTTRVIPRRVSAMSIALLSVVAWRSALQPTRSLPRSPRRSSRRPPSSTAATATTSTTSRSSAPGASSPPAGGPVPGGFPATSVTFVSSERRLGARHSAV